MSGGPSGDVERGAGLAQLRDQIARLRLQKRSRSDFRPLRAGAFYYLFAGAASVFVPMIAGLPLLGFRMLGVAAVCFGALCCAPLWANRFRYWHQIRRHNRRLERRIAALLAEIERLKAGG